MNHNNPIMITQHALERFLERFPNLLPNSSQTVAVAEAVRRAEATLQEIWSEAHYLSDTNRGILFRNPDHEMLLLVRRRQLMTVLFDNGRRVQPEIHSRTDLELSDRRSSDRPGRDRSNHRRRGT